ncbi:hypothetical protein KDL45_00050 [bacterium]|nr:hypothetical protein [bacterium]MCB9478222.1 hypothetical protein [Deltaproteobacteria bacterium]
MSSKFFIWMTVLALLVGVVAIGAVACGDDDDDDDDDDDTADDDTSDDDDDDDDDSTAIDCETGISDLYACEFVLTDESGDLGEETAAGLCADGNEDAECYATCGELFGTDCDGMESCITDTCL